VRNSAPPPSKEGSRKKGDKVRGIALKVGFALAACAVLAVTVGIGGGSKASSTLVYGGTADPTYLDPALVSDGESFRVTEAMMEGLVYLKPGTTIVKPRLATKWKTSRNGKTWTFWLRRGVKFHDGAAFNASAVCFNFNRWYNWRGPFQDASATYYYQAIYGGFKHNDVSTLSPPLYRSCAAKGPYKAVIKLRKKSGTFLPSLVISSFAMQSPKAMKLYGADQAELRNGTFVPTGTYAFQHPTGTGPFKFKSWTVGQKVELVRNDQYWGQKAKISRLIIRPIADATARLQALQNGEVNAYDLAAPQDVSTLRSNSNLKVITRSPFNVAYVTIHQGPGSPMNDLKVRQAVAYGLNRSQVVNQFYFGAGKLAQEFIPPSLPGWSKKVQKYTYNPTKAKQLLNSSSCHVPCKVDFWYPTNISRPYMPDPTRNFQAFSASLENSGFSVTPHSAPWRPTYVAKVNEGSAGDLNLIGWSGDYGDPDNFVGTFFKSYSGQFGFQNPALFNILTRAANETNATKRIALYKKTNEMIMKYLPGVPYAHSVSYLGAQKRVKNLIATPVGGTWFQYATVG
jgi:peptide/nickel transport system substrate-binding protein